MRRVSVLVAVVLLGLFAIGGRGTTAQDATPAAPAGHPLVGTWIVDPEVEDPTNPPSFDVYSVDGTAMSVGSEGATAAAWVATGPRTATVTLAGLAGGPESGASFIIRANIEVDETGERFTATHSFMLVAADGTVLTSVPEGGTASGTRLPAQSGDAGTPIAGFPTWTPAMPETGTPTP